MSDLNFLIRDCSYKNKKEIFELLEIAPIIKEGEIAGFNGIINLDNLDLKNRIENEIYNITNVFINENEVLTDNNEVNKILNSTIRAMPEFINIIGKKQHDKQIYTLDIHILTALSAVLSDKDFSQLKQNDKTALKFALLLHDIAKPEFVNDGTHPYKSSLYACRIIDKFPLKKEEKERICRIIKNHHWLADFNTHQKTPKEIALELNNINDWSIAKIMTKADLKAGGPKIYNAFISLVNDEKLKPIFNKLDNL